MQHEKEYLEILTAVKGSPKEKRLASQFIARFFKHFPKLADQAIDAHLDLCEDEDLAVSFIYISDLSLLLIFLYMNLKYFVDLIKIQN